MYLKIYGDGLTKCELCEKYRDWQEKECDFPPFDPTEADQPGYMQPAGSVMKDWELWRCEPWYGGSSGGWHTACEVVVNIGDNEAADYAAEFGDFLDYLGEKDSTFFDRHGSGEQRLEPSRTLASYSGRNRRCEAVAATKAKLGKRR